MTCSAGGNKYLEKKHDYYKYFVYEKDTPNLNFENLVRYWKENLVHVKKLGLYVHVPYCKNVCSFCDCFSLGCTDKKLNNYHKLLMKEIEKFSPVFQGTEFSSLYFGGGTPSIFSNKLLSELLENIFEKYNLKKAHLSFEGCPQTLTSDKLKILNKFNFTRVTIGVQSFDKNVLRKNNRIYSSPDVVNSILKKCKNFGISVNLELICGLPSQTKKSFFRDVEEIVRMKPNQVHLYSFEYNPATIAWYKKEHEDSVNRGAEWKQEAMEILKDLDYKNYPFSGPADDFKSINMQIYETRVNNSSLLGIGNGAMSNIDNKLMYGSSCNDQFFYKKLSKEFVEYSEIFNI